MGCAISDNSAVMAGLVPAIPIFVARPYLLLSGMPATSAGMTECVAFFAAH